AYRRADRAPHGGPGRGRRVRPAVRGGVPDRADAGDQPGRGDRAADRRRQHHRGVRLPADPRPDDLVRARVRAGDRRQPVPEPVHEREAGAARAGDRLPGPRPAPARHDHRGRAGGGRVPLHRLDLGRWLELTDRPHALLVDRPLTTAKAVLAPENSRGCGASLGRVPNYRLATVAAVASLALAAACGSDGSTSAGSGSSPAAPGSGAASGTVTVFAAASLTESFTSLGRQFEAAHPGTTVKFNFGASSSLAENINQGAPADVFASASAKNMKQVVDAGGASDSKTFANNVMQIAVPPDNPANVAQVADLANPKIKVALCQPEVPCGTVA